MERSITITFEKAREWYNSGNTSLKEIALQAFSKEELTGFDFTKIKHNDIIPLIYKRIICTLWKGHNYIPVSPEDLSGKRLFECKYCKKQHVL